MPHGEAKARTLYDKVFHDHIVNEAPDGTILLYIGPSSSPPA
jgi:3-isopropylmalate dehydratase